MHPFNCNCGHDLSKLKPALDEDVRKNFNLKKLFNEYNRKYFSGKCYEPPKLRWSQMKNALGHVAWKGHFKNHRHGSYPTDTPVIRNLTMSSYYEMGEEDFKSTLLHEMIHLYMLQNWEDFNWQGGAHGREFMELAREIGAKAGVEIGEYYDRRIKMLPINTDKVKPIIVIAFNLGNERYVIAPSNTSWQRDKYFLDDIFNSIWNGVSNIVAYETISSHTQKYRRVQNLRTNRKAYSLKPEIEKDFRKNGNVIALGDPSEAPKDIELKPIAVLLVQEHGEPHPYAYPMSLNLYQKNESAIHRYCMMNEIPYIAFSTTEPFVYKWKLNRKMNIYRGKMYRMDNKRMDAIQNNGEFLSGYKTDRVMGLHPDFLS